MSGSRKDVFTRKFLDKNVEYIGQVHRGLPHGQGKTFVCGREQYSGSWYQGQYHGQGQYRSSEGNIIVGQFDHGVMQGIGIIKFANGYGYYNGEIKDFKAHGIGKFYSADGEIREGRWNQGKPHGNFRIYMPIQYDDLV